MHYARLDRHYIEASVYSRREDAAAFPLTFFCNDFASHIHAALGGNRSLQPLPGRYWR